MNQSAMNNIEQERFQKIWNISQHDAWYYHMTRKLTELEIDYQAVLDGLPADQQKSIYVYIPV